MISKVLRISPQNCARAGSGIGNLGTGTSSGGGSNQCPLIALPASRRALLRAHAASRVAGLRVVLEAPDNAHNAAAVLRSCEAFGVAELLVVSPEKGRGSPIEDFSASTFRKVIHDQGADEIGLCWRGFWR